MHACMHMHDTQAVAGGLSCQLVLAFKMSMCLGRQLDVTLLPMPSGGQVRVLCMFKWCCAHFQKAQELCGVQLCRSSSSRADHA